MEMPVVKDLGKHRKWRYTEDMTTHSGLDCSNKGKRWLRVMSGHERSNLNTYLDLNSMDKVRSDEKINNVGALVLNDNRLSKIDLKDFSVRTNICEIAYCQYLGWIPRNLETFILKP